MRLTRRDALLSVSATLFSSFLPNMSFSQEAPRRGGVLTAHLGSEQRILNPALRASTGVYLITSKIMEALVDLDSNGNPAPVLAASWEATPDGKTVTFKLRQGVTWHDGKPFTAADVQYTAIEMWKKHLNYGTQLQQYLEAVDTPDPHTAVFRYARPMPLNLLLRALCDLGYIAPRHVFEGTNILENPANTAPIGTGPFKFVQYERGQFIIAERNPNYWRKDSPYLDRIVWRVITDKSAVAAALETGQIQLSSYNGLSLSDLDRLKARPEGSRPTLSTIRLSLTLAGRSSRTLGSAEPLRTPLMWSSLSRTSYMDWQSRQQGRSRPRHRPSIPVVHLPIHLIRRNPPLSSTRQGISPARMERALR
jgi:peptide/nickel transport system substrate-binding protein